MGFLEKAFERLNFKLDNNKLAPIEDAGDQTQDEKDLASFITNKVQEIRNNGNRVANEGIWMTNYAYTVGFSSVTYDTNLKQFRTLNRPGSAGGKNRLQVNKILPGLQRRQARLCKNPPKYEIRPDDASQEAKDTARLEKDLLEYYVDKERLLEKRQNMMMGLQNCGHYYMAMRWDKAKGRLLTAKKEDVTLEEPNGDSDTETLDSDAEFEGDVNVELVSALSIFPDPLATDLEDAQYYIEANIRKLDYFRIHYKERGHLVKEEETWLISLQNEQRIQTMVGQGPAQSGTALQMKNSSTEFIYYERRSKDHPRGRMVCVASGVILHDDDLPVGEFPHVKWDDTPITGKYYPEALVTHLRPIQDQYNNLVTKRAQWTNLMLAGKWMMPKGSQLQQEAMNNMSGEVVYYTAVPGAPAPMQMQVPVIPSYAYEEEDKLNAQFYDILGEGEVSRGILPAAGVPAIGMQLLLEQDETRISTVTAQHEYAFSKVGKLLLMYLEKYVTNERLLKIADPNAQYVIKSWKGTDITSEHDVIVVRGSTAPVSLATKRNDILNLFQQGLYGDAMDPKVKAKVLRDLEYGDVSQIWADQSADFAQINKSIKQIEEGTIPEISEFDNHQLHLTEKNKYRKSDKYTNLMPENKAIFLNDMNEHLQWLMKITAPQFGMTVNPSDQIEPQAVQIAKGMDDEAEAKLQQKMSTMGAMKQ